jgi:hypothetical protein
MFNPALPQQPTIKNFSELLSHVMSFKTTWLAETQKNLI